jgi:DNA primase
LRWEELSRDVRSEFKLSNVPERLARLKKDPWQDYEAAAGVLTKSTMAQL